ncbi:hypothetical protein [Mucilaginibacter ginsenosidivorax]|uniref:DUF4138 domain-containing protein n=1 Tax=Mucilaginibacter ginsenosidivorax TaxID=862126 RepID=A0A5B8W8W2_9SPHI|nr:hypothetical protein [Mucilaginibacter ginsenosidivorax]QEC79897.1 hypothetical protein FSB76_29520 [Mucilaginibacter ginsenosidivorax]
MKKLLLIFAIALNYSVYAQTQSVLITTHDKALKKLLESEKTGRKKIDKIYANLIFDDSSKLAPYEINVTNSLTDTVVILPEIYNKAALKKIQFKIQFDQFENARTIYQLDAPKVRYNPNALKNYIDTAKIKKFTRQYFINHPGGNSVEVFDQDIHYLEIDDEDVIVCNITSIPKGITAEVYEIPKIDWEDKYHLPTPQQNELTLPIIKGLISHRIGNTAVDINFNAYDQPYYLIFFYIGKYYVKFMDPATATPKKFSFPIP